MAGQSTTLSLKGKVGAEAGLTGASGGTASHKKQYLQTERSRFKHTSTAGAERNYHIGGIVSVQPVMMERTASAFLIARRFCVAMKKGIRIHSMQVQEFL